MDKRRSRHNDLFVSEIQDRLQSVYYMKRFIVFKHPSQNKLLIPCSQIRVNEHNKRKLFILPRSKRIIDNSRLRWKTIKSVECSRTNNSSNLSNNVTKLCRHLKFFSSLVFLFGGYRAVIIHLASLCYIHNTFLPFFFFSDICLESSVGELTVVWKIDCTSHCIQTFRAENTLLHASTDLSLGKAWDW